ncbi:MAG: DUF1887 family CARF protein [Candidatus Desulfofervidaceae bacterium]|nr:DUF1887 family CARF protein [Candidatus Desulfofervidaceae bacterium]
MKTQVRKMMVSLVSEQTIPNILAILHFQPDNLLFVSTEKMQQKHKVEAILQTLKMKGMDFSPDNYQTLVVNQDSIKDCMDKLQRWTEEINLQNFETIVNLTGGTKMMSIGAYEVFKDYPCQMIYIPIPRNEFIIPHPPKSVMPPTKLDIRLNVVEYLTAYGVSVSAEEQQKAKERGERALERFEKTAFIYEHYLKLKPFLKAICSELRALGSSSIKKIKKGKKIEVSFYFQALLDDHLKRFLHDWDFEYSSKNGRLSITCIINHDLYHYFIGGWLEEYVYKLLCDLKPKGITDVQLNLQLISPKGTQNEFDVMFTYENALYFVECKSLDQEHDKEQDILYKIGALQTDFGLRINAFLATQTEKIFDQRGEIKEHLKQRAEQMHTVILPLLQIKDLKDRLTQELFTASG